jgi:hypothetical protein
MNLFAAWKKVLLFGLFGAVGCLAGWLAGEPYLFAAKEVMKATGAAESPSLISTPAPTEPPPPPREFLDRLSAAGAKTGDVQISLIWFNTNDLDLHCVDPNKDEIFWERGHRVSRSGGELDVDRNAGCQRPDDKPVENIYWPRGKAPLGDYRVYLNFYQRCPGAPNETEWKINILYGGQRREFAGSIRKEDTPDGGPKKIIHSFRLDPRVELFAPAEVELKAGAARRVPFAVRRDFYQGKLSVAATNLPANVSADPVSLADGVTDGELVLRAGDAAAPGRTVIKITATGEGVAHSADPELVVPKPPFSPAAVLSTGAWTALLAVGLCVALLAGQNRYLGKSPFSPGRVPLAGVVVGAALAGFVSGGIGQALYFALSSLGAASVGFLFGWLLLGALLGAGVSFFVPNLDAKRAALAGLGGGLLGAVAFWTASAAADWIGRLGGAALLGFCIGLMVAAVEAAFRRAWLEVRYGGREVITVNLGPEPVKVGGDPRACTVWARGADPVALRYWVRDGRVFCEDVPAGRESAVADGDSRVAGGVTVVVRGAAAAGDAAAPLRSVAPPVPAPAAAAPLPPPPVPAAPPKANPSDYDDGLPAPLGPPPARPAAASILDADEYRPAAPASPAPPPPPAPPKSAPVAPPAAAAPKPPPAPKPAAPAAPTGAPPADAAPCPTCGRRTPGAPGARYCMVCDRTF